MSTSETVDGATHAERTTIEHVRVHPNGHPGARHVLDGADLDVQDVAVQEQNRAERLILR